MSLDDQRKRLDEFGVEQLYYITPVQNLQSILARGILSHELAQSLPHLDISLQDVNERRSGRVEPYWGTSLHCLVPMYFNPRIPMLYRRRNMQDSLAILCLNRELLFEVDTVFTDGNAASGASRFFRDLEMLEEIDWECIWAHYWNEHQDGTRKRCAEVLVPSKVDTSEIQMILCLNKRTNERVKKLDLGGLPCAVSRPHFFI